MEFQLIDKWKIEVGFKCKFCEKQTKLVEESTTVSTVLKLLNLFFQKNISIDDRLWKKSKKISIFEFYYLNGHCDFLSGLKTWINKILRQNLVLNIDRISETQIMLEYLDLACLLSVMKQN